MSERHIQHARAAKGQSKLKTRGVIVIERPKAIEPKVASEQSGSDSDSESELLAQLQQFQKKPQKIASWRKSAIRKPRENAKPSGILVVNDPVENASHKDFINKFIK